MTCNVNNYVHNKTIDEWENTSKSKFFINKHINDGGSKSDYTQTIRTIIEIMLSDAKNCLNYNHIDYEFISLALYNQSFAKF